MSELTLVIANKAYSSWSLRPWLALMHAGVMFEEIVIPLRRPETADAIARHTPAGKVPVLRHGEVIIWESIAILEYLAELFPDAGLWPAERAARAHARTVSAEMHAGFTALRSNMPMNVRASLPGRGRTPEVARDVARITALWRDCRARFGDGGPFLFGAFGNADAMFAPVVTRFQTYGVELDPVSQAYADAVLHHPAMRAWYQGAHGEEWVIGDYELS
jgi:glutathione S-transferase